KLSRRSILDTTSRGRGGIGRRGGFRSRWAARPLEVRVLSPAYELVDARRRPRQRRLVEEVRRRVPELVDGAVEVVRAVRGVEAVAERDLVADDEDLLLRPCEEPPEAFRIPARGVVEALAAGERVRAGVNALPGAVLVDRHALELADVDVVEERLDDHRHLAVADRERRRLEGPPEARPDAEVE